MTSKVHGIYCPCAVPVHFKAAILLLITYCTLWIPLSVGVFCLHPISSKKIVSFINLLRGCFPLIVFLLLCVCVYVIMSLPQGAMGWSVICDCSIYWSCILILSQGQFIRKISYAFSLSFYLCISSELIFGQKLVNGYND